MRIGISLALFCLTLLFSFNTQAQPMAYVPGFDNTIRVIDTSTNMVVATIPLIGQARGAVVTPDGTKVYAPIGGADRVAVIQTSTNTVLTNITVGDNPSDVAISPDGTTAWVAHFSGTNNPDIVTRIDTATDTVVTTVSVGNCPPREILTTPADGDGNYFVYVNGGLTCGDVFRIDPATNMRIGPTFDFTSTSIFNRPTSMDITPDGSKIYVGISNNVTNTNFIEIIDIAADGTPSLDPMPISINNAVPEDIAAAPVGNNVWVMVNPGTFPLNCIFILINRTDNSFVCITGSAMLPNPSFSNVGFLRDGSSYYGSTINLGGSVEEVDNGLPITFLGDPIDISVAPFLRSPYFIGPDTAQLTVSKTGDGGGTVTSSNPSGIDCGDTCDATIVTGTEVTLTAVADMNSMFIGWGGDCSGTGDSTMITVSVDASCTAEFEATVFTLTAAINQLDTGSDGTVTSDPAGINCPGDCSEDYDVDTMVDLTATPNSISEFVDWSNDCSGTDNPTTIDIQADSLCTANFQLTDFTLDVAIEGPGGGTITSNPGDIDCPGTCSNIFQATTDVGLTAVPDAVSVFNQWNDDCMGTNPSTNIVLLEDSVCTAQFDFKPLELGVFPGKVNTRNTITVNNSTPGGRVVFYYGFQKGKTILGGACSGENLGIKKAKRIGAKPADSSGVAKIKLYVPVQYSSRKLYFRAVDTGTCRLSNNLLVIPPPG